MQLVGTWSVDPTDDRAVAEFGDTSMTFTNDGALTYVIKADGKLQIMKMTYRVEDGTIVSNQPSSPREERTPFDIQTGDVLVLSLEGVQHRFLRKAI